ISTQSSYTSDISTQNSYVADISTQSSYTPDISTQNTYASNISTQNSYTPPDTSNNIEVVSYGSYNSNPRVSNINKNSIINKIEADAKHFLGTRYVWGATGPNKFDCSGFTQWIYRDAGINIPRVSRDQAKVGKYISFNNLRKGDMIFFDTKKHKKGIVTHVGIYLGNGNFIHASSAAKKVVVFNWNDKPYYKKRFLWGRRVVNDNTLYASN
ncbi:MAG: C40 family peptidase, partial [Sulfurovaceae bacterium]|nr:C40 family peptidase [Sulfurovaceae bacterium]